MNERDGSVIARVSRAVKVEFERKAVELNLSVSELVRLLIEGLVADPPTIEVVHVTEVKGQLNVPIGEASRGKVGKEVEEAREYLGMVKGWWDHGKRDRVHDALETLEGIRDKLELDGAPDDVLKEFNVFLAEVNRSYESGDEVEITGDTWTRQKKMRTQEYLDQRLNTFPRARANVFGVALHEGKSKVSGKYYTKDEIEFTEENRAATCEQVRIPIVFFRHGSKPVGVATSLCYVPRDRMYGPLAQALCFGFESLNRGPIVVRGPANLRFSGELWDLSVVEKLAREPGKWRISPTVSHQKIDVCPRDGETKIPRCLIIDELCITKHPGLEATSIELAAGKSMILKSLQRIKAKKATQERAKPKSWRRPPRPPSRL